MPLHQDFRLRPCGSLLALSLAGLEKPLVRAFYFLSRQGSTSKPEDVLLGVGYNSLIPYLCEKYRQSDIQQIRSYLIPRLPLACRQLLVDNVMSKMCSPEVQDDQLLTGIEFQFRSCDVVIGSSDMSQAVQIYLKCLLLNFVTKLDFGDLYARESCWVARARRVLHMWDEVKEKDNKYPEGIKDGKVDTDCLEFLWRDLIFEHGKAVTKGAIAAASYFRKLVNINIDYVATGELVWAIGCNCPLLQDLSLYLDTTDRSRYSTHFELDLINGVTALFGHKKVTPTSFHGQPIGCPKLQRIVMPSVGFQEKLEICAGKLLCYLSRLKEVINLCTTAAFIVLLREDDFKPKPLALTFIDNSRTETVVEDICCYRNMQTQFFFPKVTNIRISQSKHRKGLKTLSSFPKVTRVEVVSLDDDGELEFGTNLNKITHFKSNCKWDEKKLAGFSQRAPNLKVLAFLSGSIHKHKKCRDTISFPGMTVIKFHKMTHIDSEPFTSLIKGTKLLTHIFIEQDEVSEGNHHNVFTAINDRVISVITPSLKKLVCFEARIKKFRGHSHYSMTLKSFNTLIHGCLELELIGNLYHWNIPYREVMALKTLVRSKNWNINFDVTEFGAEEELED